MFEIIENGPYIHSLNNEEYYSGGELLIEWDEPIKQDTSAIYWVEIYFTEDYKKDKSRWIQIARIPSKQYNYTWKIDNWIKSNNCRIAIRFVDNHGNRSRYSILP
ncbi:MAG: hypothetical protein ACOCRK_07100, partial [bacterium]